MTPEKLREIYGAPIPKAVVKTISSFDAHCRAFIGQSSLLVLATSDGGTLDVSPKGDAAGFVTVESDTTLLIPDRPGNNRIDGLLNILRHPEVALLFLIPTVSETLRVNGHATILDDPGICAGFAEKGRAPKTVLRVTASEIFVHCGRALTKSGIWEPATWPKSRPVKGMHEILADHCRLHAASPMAAAEPSEPAT